MMNCAIPVYARVYRIADPTNIYLYKTNFELKKKFYRSKNIVDVTVSLKYSSSYPLRPSIGRTIFYDSGLRLSLHSW